MSYRGFVVHLTNGDELHYAGGHHYAVLEGATLQIMRDEPCIDGGEFCIDVMLIAPHEWKLVKPMPGGA